MFLWQKARHLQIVFIKVLSAWNLEMQDTVEHNFKHLLNRGWLEHLDKFDVQFWHDGKGQLL